MRIKENTLDSIIYVLLCIFTVGGAWLVRILISQSIRMAIKSEPE